MGQDAEATQLAADTKDAYSYERYGAIQWLKCCIHLLKRYTVAEAECILRSKFMRWAADGAPGKPTATALMEFVSQNNPHSLFEEVGLR